MIVLDTNVVCELYKPIVATPVGASRRLEGCKLLSLLSYYIAWRRC